MLFCYVDIIESIRDAIRNKHIIQFTYEGRIRISEPHVLGIKNGITEMLMFQIGGEALLEVYLIGEE